MIVDNEIKVHLLPFCIDLGKNYGFIKEQTKKIVADLGIFRRRIMMVVAIFLAKLGVKYIVRKKDAEDFNGVGAVD